LAAGGLPAQPQLGHSKAQVLFDSQLAQLVQDIISIIRVVPVIVHTSIAFSNIEVAFSN
jgi:hypothetical protein